MEGRPESLVITAPGIGDSARPAVKTWLSADFLEAKGWEQDCSCLLRRGCPFSRRRAFVLPWALVCLYQVHLEARPLRHCVDSHTEDVAPTCSSPWAAVQSARRRGQSSRKASLHDSGGHKSRNQGAPSGGSGDCPLPASGFWQPLGSAVCVHTTLVSTSPVTRPLCLSSVCLLYGHLSLDLGSMWII